MPDWLRIVKSHHAKMHPSDGYNLVTRPPASDRELDDVSTTLGVEFPREFKSLFKTCNGFGVVHEEDEPDKIWWFLRPTDQLRSFVDGIRNAFPEVHEKHAKRFFPFIDFSNGDALGYLVDEAGIIIDGLFCFEHEFCRFDEEQDINEFLSHTPLSIEELLTQI